MAAQSLDWVNTSIAALGLIGGGIGFFRAVWSGRRAQKAETAAADAQADAAAALTKNSEMTERIAVALEAMARPNWNDLFSTRFGGAGAAEEQDPRDRAFADALNALTVAPGIAWSLERREGAPDTYRLRNVGNSDARVVHVEGSPDTVSSLASIRGAEGSTVDEVLAGSSVVVGVSNRLTLTVHEIKVWWSEDGNNEAQSQVLELPD
jgi:hypothetical protein